jgi:hypothetical protein
MQVEGWTKAVSANHHLQEATPRNKWARLAMQRVKGICVSIGVDDDRLYHDGR